MQYQNYFPLGKVRFAYSFNTKYDSWHLPAKCSKCILYLDKVKLDDHINSNLSQIKNIIEPGSELN